MKKYLFPILIFLVLMGTRAFTFHNSYDSLPSARAFVSDWLANDWYLSQKVPYRFLFNVPAGFLYEFTNFFFAFFSLKVIQFALFAVAFSKLLPKVGLGVLGSLVFLLFFSSNQSMVAMEWIYGDSDAKPFAYLFFFFALNSYFDKKYDRGAFFMGLSSSFHVLVGGYLSIAYFLVRFFQDKNISFKECFWFLVGALGAIWAVIYELSSPSYPSADLIYVFMRVSHHVVPDWKLSGWIFEYILFNILFLVVWFKTKSRMTKALVSFPLISNIFWILGLVVYSNGHYDSLKYYFFRVGDTLFPFVAFLLIVRYLESFIKNPKVAKSLVIIVMLIVSGIFTKRLQEFISKDEELADAYVWIRDHTAKDAVFMVDPTTSNFYVKAERPMLVSYKNFPQLKKHFEESLERLEFATQLKLDRTKEMDRATMSRAYSERNPEKDLEKFKTYQVDYVMSKNPISSEFYKLVFSGKNSYIYQLKNIH